MHKVSKLGRVTREELSREGIEMRLGENAGCIILFIRVLQQAFSSKSVRIQEKGRKLTLLAKINIVKAVGLSKLIYNASAITVSP